MSGSVQQGPHAIVDILSKDGCGYTLDLHKGNGEGHIVQWLWAKPVAAAEVADSVTVTDSGSDVARRLTDLGLTPGPTSPYITQLDDEVGLLEECPFQPAACEGPHVVACGAGLLPHQ